MTSPEPASFTLEPGAGGSAVTVSFDAGSLAGGAAEDESPLPSPWSVGGEVDWDRAEALRLISAVFEDGRELAIVAIRARGVDGHDAESVVTHLVEQGEVVAVEAAYISTEYDPEGMPRRLGVELWTNPERAPLRVAADREGRAAVSGDGVRRESTRMRFRLEGSSGAGLYEVLRQP